MEDVTDNVAIYVVWFPTAGLLLAFAGLLISRDGEVQKALADRGSQSLSRLNEFIWESVRSAKSIVLPDDYAYDAIRDQKSLEELAARTRRPLRARRAQSLSGFFTKALVVTLFAHIVGV